MDKHAKILLTVIAIALIGINVQLLMKPAPAYALYTGPTVGDRSKCVPGTLVGKKERDCLNTVLAKVPLVYPVSAPK